MAQICLVDYGDVKLTNETQRICYAVFDEYDFPLCDLTYVHMYRSSDIDQVEGYDLVIALGAEATSVLCQTSIGIKKYAGAMTWNEQLDSWVLPTLHPNCLYQHKYNDFDVVYDALKRAVDLCNDELEWPSKEGHSIDWEFIGHNGEGWDPEAGEDRQVWSGYFEYTDEENERQWEILSEWIALLDQGDPVLFGIDTESYNLNYIDPMTMIQVYDGNKAYAFTWGVIEQGLDLWRLFFNHPHARFTWHHRKHDDKMIHYWVGVPFFDERHDDTMCWAQGLTEKGNQTGLKYRARQHCNAPFYEESLDVWVDWSDNGKRVNFGHVRPDVLAEYGCDDVYYGYQLSSVLKDLVVREGTQSSVTDTLLPASAVLAEMEYAGILVDDDLRQQLSATWHPRIEAAILAVQQYAAKVGFPQDPKVVKGQIRREYCECVLEEYQDALADARVMSYRKILREKYGLDDPCESCDKRRYVKVVDPTLNVHSPAQMHHLCFDILDMSQTHEGRSCGGHFWDLNDGHELTELVERYRKLDYLHTNFIVNFKEFIWPDGRVHPTFSMDRTKTGRLSAQRPPMHGVPAHSDDAKLVKRMFLPDPGQVLVNADYSSLELYMAQHLTGDPALLEALNTGDIHTSTAAAMYLKTAEEVLVEERSSAKPVTFGAGYNAKAKTLALDPNLVNIVRGQPFRAQRFLDRFWGKFNVWDEIRHGWIEEALENCELTTELGRKRRWSIITKNNQWKVANQACNFKGQSMASDLCLRSLVTVHRELQARGWGRVILTVHDSIVYSIDPTHLHEAVVLIRKTMTTAPFKTTTPFKVEVTVGPNYGDQEPYDPEMSYAALLPG